MQFVKLLYFNRVWNVVFTPMSICANFATLFFFLVVSFLDLTGIFLPFNHFTTFATITSYLSLPLTLWCHWTWRSLLTLVRSTFCIQSDSSKHTYKRLRNYILSGYILSSAWLLLCRQSVFAVFLDKYYSVLTKVFGCIFRTPALIGKCQLTATSLLFFRNDFSLQELEDL